MVIYFSLEIWPLSKPLESDNCDEDEDALFWLRFPLDVDPASLEDEGEDEDEDGADVKVTWLLTSSSLKCEKGIGKKEKGKKWISVGINHKLNVRSMGKFRRRREWKNERPFI